MDRIAIIGFGEAGRVFSMSGIAAKAAFDSDPRKRQGIADHADAAAVLGQASLILSLVTADQALAAARAYAPLLMPGALWCDMNSVAPVTKRAAAEAVVEAGARYLDVAVMAPVDPAGAAVPLLVAGDHAEEGAGRLRHAGFVNVRITGSEIGRASAIKMIRSVMVKGVEALTAEMMAAAEAAGVTDDVLGSLGDDWPRRAGYNLDRMRVHGARRAAEMEESVLTLETLGIEPVMTRGTVLRQRAAAGAGGIAA